MKASIYIPVKGERIEITERRCSDKVQPHIKLKTQMIVQDVNRLKSGPVQIVATLNNKTYKVNSDRFGWKKISTEQVFSRMCEEAQQRAENELVWNLNNTEKAKIIVAPLIIIQIIWYYTGIVLKLAAQNKVEILKKLSRTIKLLQEKYEKDTLSELDFVHYTSMVKQTNSFIEEKSMDFTLFYYSVNSQFLKKHPDYPYKDMRSYAIMTMALIQCLDEYNKQMDKILEKKVLKKRDSVRPAFLEHLYNGMEAISGDMSGFNFSETNVSNAKKIFINNISNVDFSVVG